MTLNLIEHSEHKYITQNTSKTRHYMFNFQKFKIFLKILFSKNVSSKKSGLYADFNGIISIVEGHTA